MDWPWKERLEVFSLQKASMRKAHGRELHFIPKPKFMEPGNIQGWASGPVGPPGIALSRILHAHVSGESVHRMIHQAKNHRKVKNLS